MSDVRLEDLTKSFKGTTAVDHIDLVVEEGEFFSLLGPSGCGKTTTLRMIGGFEEPTSGHVYLGGDEVSALPPYKRNVNTVFQSYALLHHLNVADNVAYGLKRKKVSESAIKDRVQEMLALVDLSGFGARRINQLSGGQQQRVALARALVNSPSVLLLDEPLGALDLKLRKGLQVQLKEIQREVGITFVYVTHDQEEALTMSDRIAVMNRGVIEQLAAPEDVYERPRTEFVAGFIGVSNLLPGVVESVSGDQVDLRLDSGPTIRTRGAGVQRGDRCHAVVRPEKLTVTKVEEPPPAGQPSVEGVVEAAVFLGTATQMVVKVAGDVRLTVLVPNADEAERQRLPGAGARVHLAWASENMHVVSGSGASSDAAAHNAPTDETASAVA